GGVVVDAVARRQVVDATPIAATLLGALAHAIHALKPRGARPAVTAGAPGGTSVGGERIADHATARRSAAGKLRLLAGAVGTARVRARQVVAGAVPRVAMQAGTAGASIAAGAEAICATVGANAVAPGTSRPTCAAGR